MLNLFQSILKVLTTGREYGGRSNCRLKFVEAFQRCQVELFAHNNMGSGNLKKKLSEWKFHTNKGPDHPAYRFGKILADFWFLVR